jgi:predicted transcriptional regulator of viral defense system
VTRGWLSDKLGCSLDAASIKLARMAQKGLIRRVAKGAYIAPAMPTAEEYVTVPIGEELADEPKPVPLGAEEEVRA